jgi:hypothetical protein
MGKGLDILFVFFLSLFLINQLLPKDGNGVGRRLLITWFDIKSSSFSTMTAQSKSAQKTTRA